MNGLRIVKVLTGMLLILSTFVFLSLGTASASQWIKTYGGSGSDGAESIQQTSDGGYIVAGETTSFGAGSGDAWVLKLDDIGNVVWQKTYGSNVNAHSILQTTDGGYIVAGATSFSRSALVLKLDGNGNVQWQKTYGGSIHNYAMSIQQTSDGGYILAGGTDSFGAGNYDAWVLKLDNTGNVQWQKAYGGTYGDYAESIQQTSDGGYVVAGYTYSFNTGLRHGAWILKLDGNGNVQWQKLFVSWYGESSAYSIQQTSDGGYIVAAAFAFDPQNNYDAWIMKLDGGGNMQWSKVYDYNFRDDWPYSIQQTSDGGYIVAGKTGGDAWVLKLDGSGDVQWQKAYGGTTGYGGAGSSDGAKSIQQTSDGGYVVAGYTYSFGAGNNDVWVLKLDGNGNIYDVCSIVKTSDATLNDTYTNISGISLTGIDTNISPQTSTASVSNTNAAVKEQCVYGCSLVPDATTIQRGGTLELQATVTNNTDKTGSVLAATKVTLPNGNRYPSSGYLFGPISISLDPYQSKSGHLSHIIPSNAPLGWYIYHGYVGNYGVGIYDECQFTFEVTSP